MLSIRFFVQLISIIRLRKRCLRKEVHGTQVLTHPDIRSPFSFFRWIFVYPSQHEDEELNEILAHEQAHANQLHSVDVVASELIAVVCWFNPFVWLMKREVRNNLEFLADRHVQDVGYDSKTYQYHLLALTYPKKRVATLYNNFNVLPLKIRISMMNRKRSYSIGRAKYLLFLPLAALLTTFGSSATAQNNTPSTAIELSKNIKSTDNVICFVDGVRVKSIDNIDQSDIAVINVIKDRKEIGLYGDPDKVQGVIMVTTKDKKAKVSPMKLANQTNDVVFEVVENMPQFPGGMKAMMEYLKENVKYPDAAIKANTQGRVVTQFIVDKDGNVTMPIVVHSVSLDLDKEAIRVVSAMPKWKPGTQRGKAVNVRFTLPIAFSLSAAEAKEATKK
jgi:TonB family protein